MFCLKILNKKNTSWIFIGMSNLNFKQTQNKKLKKISLALVFLFSLSIFCYGLLTVREISRENEKHRTVENTNIFLNFYNQKKNNCIIPIAAVQSCNQFKRIHIYSRFHLVRHCVATIVNLVGVRDIWQHWFLFGICMNFGRREI